MTLRFVLIQPVVLGALLFSSCSSGGDDPDGEKFTRLTAVGDNVRTMEEGDELTLEFIYDWNFGYPIPNAAVHFAVSGMSNGGTLSGFTAITDEDGHVAVVVRAGLQATFDVVATVDDQTVAPAMVRIQVGRARFGTLTYTVTYTGPRTIRGVETGLFTNTTCANLAHSVPFAREVQHPQLAVPSHFGSVETGINHAIYALGIDEWDAVTAEGCADVRLTSPQGSVTIPLNDGVGIYGGRYVIRETVNVTEGFPSGLDAMLDIFGALGSDNPGAYVVDWVLHSDTVDDEIKFAVAAFAPIVEMLINDLVGDLSPPGPLEEIVDLGADLNTAFSNVVIMGKLTTPEPMLPELEVDATHRIESIGVLVDGTVVEQTISAEAPVHVTFGDRIILDEREFAIPFGALFETVFNNVLLPRLPGEPHSIGELMAIAFNCDGIAYEDPIAQAAAQAACNAGATLIGEQLENQLVTMWGFDTLYLSDAGDLTDMDHDFVRDRMDGDTQGRWVGSSGEMIFDGTLEGWRDDGQSRQRHPIRERLREGQAPN